ncbi:component of SufBCD complex [Actibacterium pelagium]|uniref:component of SufBCD complex n=1 Tax=Actibacterium pelagium TaxID=2029103 RepID=UPI001178A26E|nr:component of SufBCD complex [Actibacterium pelagium]
MELLDMQSFSNLWYWIVLAVVWASVSYFMMGVPYDMYRQARWHGGQAQEDLITLLKIYIRRVDHILAKSGLFIIAFTFFLISLMVGLGFFYGNEFSQAVLLIFVPACMIAALNVRNCKKVKRLELYNEPDKLYRLMARYRLTVQIIGVVDIVITTFWGIAVNFTRTAIVG